MHTSANQLSLFATDTDRFDSDGFDLNGSDLNGFKQEPQFSVRESARAKRLTIKVFPRGRVEVVVPRRTRPADVRDFVTQNREWIQKTQDAYAAEHPLEPFVLPKVIQLSSIDQTIHVRYVPKMGAEHVRFRCSQGVLTLTGSVARDADCVDALRRWLAAMAKRELGPRLRLLSVETELPFQRLQIRAQRTRWGSRSSSGTISLNLCALFLTPELQRYLMIHELCHGPHMNHSKRFWKCVSRFEPNYRALDRQLTDSWRQMPIWLGMS